MVQDFVRQQYGYGSTTCTKMGALVNGTKDYHLRNPGSVILSHTHMVATKAESQMPQTHSLSHRRRRPESRASPIEATGSTHCYSSSPLPFGPNYGRAVGGKACCAGTRTTTQIVES